MKICIPSFGRFLALFLLVIAMLVTFPCHSVWAATAAPNNDADIDRLIQTLQDDQARAGLVKQLELLRATKPAPEPPTPSDLIADAAGRLQIFGGEVVDSATVLINFPYLLAWFQAEWADPAALAAWAEVLRTVAVILGAALAADWGVRFAVARLRRPSTIRLDRPGWPSRLFGLVIDLILDGLPIIAFAATAGLVIPLVHPHRITANVAGTVIAAVLIGRMLLVLARIILLAPREQGWTLIPLEEETTNYLYIWTRRFVITGVYGFGFCWVMWWLSVPGAVYALSLKLVALAITILAIVFILQNRQAVASGLRPQPQPDGVVLLRPHSLDALRSRLAEIWHVLATLYAVGIWVVYALHIDGGFLFLGRATLLTVLLFTATRVLIGTIGRLTQRGFAIPAELIERFPTIEARANRYLPAVTMIGGALIWLLSGLSLLEIWGLGSYSWLTSTLGRRITAGLFSIGTILVLAFGFWEIVNAAIDRYLAGVDGNGNRVTRSARMRTLLPLLRNALWVTLLLFVMLLVLSELGFNIAPLLAGAGVVGLAIGFGSQALVKDIITGLFMLIEDTVAMGDVVDLGNGHAGVIEGISIRTIKLRDAEGSVHTVPFSEISRVKNLSKGFAYWVIDLVVALGADTDQVLALYQEIAAELRADPQFSPYILADLEPIGVSGFGIGAVHVQARIKTAPLKNGTIGFEFNRRIKRAFTERGIPLPQAEQILRFGTEITDALEALRQAPVPAPAPSAAVASALA